MIVSLPEPGHRGRLDEQHLAADRRPGEPGGDARDLGPPAGLGEDPAAAEQLARALRGDRRAPARLRRADSASSRASLRHTVPISRSRLRTPASRVYSSMIARSAASENRMPAPRRPFSASWRGTR